MAVTPVVAHELAQELVPELVQERGLALIAALTSAAAQAHNETTLGQRIAEALSEWIPLREIVLESAMGRRAWPGRAGPSLEVHEHVIGLADGRRVLVATAGARLGANLERAIAAVIASSFAHVATLARVAALSNRAHRDRELLREQLAQAEPEIVCESEAMRRLVRETLPLVAPQDVTVLVRGESGTGKELVVRRLHALSRRARRALVTVNCGALAEGVAESTLFGHEAGAFTGASARHLGIFERAHGGTVFLDEVGELSPSSQARLLRVLSSGEVTRVGGALSHRVDVRVVAATHRPLEAMIADGRFRQDLFFRLNVVPIEVPPLRERREDVAPLARAILAKIAARAGRPAPTLREVDLARLVAWSWPGNVRELENVLQRALVLSGEGELALPQGWEGLAPRGGDASSPQDGVAERFDDAVRTILVRALEACEGRIHGPSGAAARLGLPPTTLQAKLRKLGVRQRRAAAERPRDQRTPAASITSSKRRADSVPRSASIAAIVSS